MEHKRLKKGPERPQNGVKTTPKRAPNDVKTMPKVSPSDPKMTPDRPKNDPKSPKNDTFLTHLWPGFGPFLALFWAKLTRFGYKEVQKRSTRIERIQKRFKNHVDLHESA